jgi:sugar phosphate isomerase/epimerase
MLRLSMNAMTTTRWSFVEDVDEYYKAGIEGIGVWRRKLLDFGEERGAELLHDSGLTVSSLSNAGGFTGDSGESYCDAIHDAFDAVRLAAMIRATSLVLVSGSQNGHIHSHARRILRSALRELVPAAAQLRVQLILRPMLDEADRRWTFLDSCQSALEIVADFGPANVGLMLDIGQLAKLAVDSEQIADWLPRIRMVAVRSPAQLASVYPEQFGGDADRNRPLNDLLAELQRSNPRGYAEIQFLPGTAPHRDYTLLLRACGAAARCSTELIVQPSARAPLGATAPIL